MPASRDPRSYVKPVPLPVPSCKGVRLLARDTFNFNPEEPSRETVRKNNYYRRQAQMSQMGFKSLNHKPYQGIGDPFYLDEKKMILHAFGQWNEEDSESSASSDESDDVDKKTSQKQSAVVDGKVALVTGSTSGIGLGIAHHLAGKGCDVIVTGFGTPEEIDAILTQFKGRYKGKFTYVKGDLSQQDSTLELCKEVTKEYPDGVDIIINNAGIQYVCPVEDYPLSKFNEMVAINLAAPFIITQYFIPFMKKKGWGRIVNTASQMGMISQVGKTPYSCTKAGLLGFTRGTALELAPHGITCNAICPGYVETQLLATQLEALAKKESVTYERARDMFFKEKNPTGKPVTIQEIANFVGFLCSNEAASITGASLSIDAGHPIM